MNNGNSVSHGEKLKRRKILLADDDPGILDAISMMLEDAGYEVETSVDGAIVQDMREEVPDLLLLDIWMSGMDGREICKKLKSQKKTKHIPIIIISANRDTDRIAREAGADDFLAKPFEMDELLAKVAKYL
jgi:DNA-binding response OmpR family regulator